MIFFCDGQIIVNTGKLIPDLMLSFLRGSEKFAAQRPDSVSPGDPFANVAAEGNYWRRVCFAGGWLRARARGLSSGSLRQEGRARIAAAESWMWAKNFRTFTPFYFRVIVFRYGANFYFWTCDKQIIEITVVKLIWAQRIISPGSRSKKLNWAYFSTSEI